jgi:TRAP-type mannitol/chloroaromatic compound transport system permease small subunit
VSGLLRLSVGIDWLSTQVGRLAAWCVLAACLISAGNAVSRYAAGISSNAWLEIQWYLFAGMVMLGGPVTLKVNGHVRVDLVYGNLPPRAQAWLDLVCSLIFLLPAAAVIGWLSWPLFEQSFGIGETSNNAGGLLRWPVKLLLPVGFALLFLQGVSEIIKRVAALTGHRDLAPRYVKPLQ